MNNHYELKKSNTRCAPFETTKERSRSNCCISSGDSTGAAGGNDAGRDCWGFDSCHDELTFRDGIDSCGTSELPS